MRKTVILLAMILFLVGCQEKTQTDVAVTPDPCSVEIIKKYIDESEKIESKFRTLTELADNISKEELELTIKEMQELEKELKEIEAPPCALKAKSAIVSYFESMIQGYLRQYTEELGIQPQFDVQTSDEIFVLAESKNEYYKMVLKDLEQMMLEKNTE